ncbi:MAG: tetratricopeptide repeat protein [Deltaproteobacteria bacterium]|nr:tetratricopeptide repeat protein [Deltaproteobacteria bacterium]
MLQKLFIIFIFFTGVNFISIDAGAKDKKNFDGEIDVDTLDIARVLIKDKHFDRSLAVLSDIDISKTTIDKSDYYLLLGITHMSLENVESAKDAFLKSVENGVKDKMVYLFLGQIFYKLNDYQKSIEYLEKGKSAADHHAASFLLKANAWFRINNFAAAFDTLDEGIKKFPDDRQLQENRILLYIDAKLFQKAIILAEKYLSNDEVTAENYTAMSEAFIRGGEPQKAIIVLEAARLLYPDKNELTAQLARAYVKNGQELVAARLFQQAYLENEKDNEMFLLDAAELFRRHGQYYQALQLNKKISDQKTKIKQRAGILVETGQFEEIALMVDRLERLDLLKDDSILYAVAYSFFKISDFVNADLYLSKIRDSKYFDKAVELRRAIEQCRHSGWQCE